MTTWREIDDIKQLVDINARLHEILRAKLSSTAVTRPIGWPNGAAPGKIYFQPGSNEDSLWFHGYRDTKSHKEINFFGHGAPKGHGTLNIEIQFNFPYKKFNRMTGGAFLVNDGGEIFLAHRGIVTLGHARLNKQAVLHSAVKREITIVQTKIGRTTRDFMIVAKIKPSTIIKDISIFTEKIRQIAKSVAAENSDNVFPAKPTAQDLNRQAKIKEKLLAFRKEFDGTSAVPPRASKTVNHVHGKIVNAMAAILKSRGLDHINTREMDLIGISDRMACLFEVKSATNTQSMYTAIGQLLVHDSSAKRICRGVNLKRVVVLPKNPEEKFSFAFKRCNISIVTYVKDGKGYRFEGLFEQFV